MAYVAQDKLEVVSSVSGILQICALLLGYNTTAADHVMLISAATSYVLMRNLLTIRVFHMKKKKNNITLLITLNVSCIVTVLTRKAAQTLFGSLVQTNYDYCDSRYCQ